MEDREAPDGAISTWWDQKVPKEVPVMSGAEFRRVKPDDIQFDHSYQRQPIPSRITKMAENWNEDAAQPPLVNVREDGTIWGVDGQQRTLARIEMGKGNKPVLCEARIGLTSKEEAELFLVRDDRRPLSSLNKWMSGQVAGDPVVLGIDKYLRKIGVKVSAYKSPMTLQCASELRGLYRAGLSDEADEHEAYVEGFEYVYRVIHLADVTWREQDILTGVADRFASQLVRGMAHMLATHEIDDKRFVDRLGQVSPRQVVLAARAVATSKGKMANQAALDIVAEVLYKHYKSRRRTLASVTVSV